MSARTSLVAALVFGLATTAQADELKPLNDIISARVGGLVSASDTDAAYQHVYSTAWAAWIRLQFGAGFGKYVHVALAWEPRLGGFSTSDDPANTFDGGSPFELLAGTWLYLGKARGMVRAGYFWDWGSFGMGRFRYDWGGGAAEITLTIGAAEQRVGLAYRLRLAEHFTLMVELRGLRTTRQLSYSMVAPDGSSGPELSRTISGLGVQALVSIEWALNGE